MNSEHVARKRLHNLKGNCCPLSTSEINIDAIVGVAEKACTCKKEAGERMWGHWFGEGNKGKRAADSEIVNGRQVSLT